MDNPQKSNPYSEAAKSAEETHLPHLDEEERLLEARLFEYELEFLETTRQLIDALERYKEPDRIAYTYTMIGMSHDVYNYPAVIDDYTGNKDFDSIDITVNNEGISSSTTVEMHGSFGTVYLSRDAAGPESDDDQEGDKIIDLSGETHPIDTVPARQINDFLFSISQRGVDPAITRQGAMNGSIERVNGEDMRDALEAAAYSSLVHYSYTLNEHTTLWFSRDGIMGKGKIKSITLHYKDSNMDHRVVEIKIDKGMNITFVNLESDNPLAEDLNTREEDYAMALQIINEETDNIIRAANEAAPVVIELLPPDLLKEL